MHRLLALACLLLLTACANQPLGEFRTDACFAGYVDEAKLLAQLAAAKPCCTSLDKLEFAVPEPSKSHAITRASPVFDFPSGRSRFVAFDLAGYPSDRLHLMNQDVGLTAPVDATCAAKMASTTTEGPYGRRAFIPVVTWLDEQRQVVTAGAGGSLAVLGRADAQHVGWLFERPKNGRYAVVHTDPAAHSSVVVIDAPRFASVMPVPTPFGVALVPNFGGGQMKLVGASTGVFFPLLTRAPLVRPAFCTSSPELAGCAFDETARSPEQFLGPP
jgi:hypothetical protein